MTKARSEGNANSLLSADGPISKALQGFTVRPQQQAMATMIEEVLGDSGTLLCEAGTGTGKTLAYLVPCLEFNRKTIISTATKTLQDQLFQRDIPLVQEALDVELSVALLKGRANYLCLHRLELAHGSRDIAPIERRHLTYLREWSRDTERGDIATAADLPAIFSMIVLSSKRGVTPQAPMSWWLIITCCLPIWHCGRRGLPSYCRALKLSFWMRRIKSLMLRQSFLDRR